MIVLWLPPFHNCSIKMLSFFSVTLKRRDFVYPCLCLFNILLSGGVSDRLFSRRSLQTASKHSTASSNRTIFNFPLPQCAGKCDWEEHHNGMWLKTIVIIFQSLTICKHWFIEDLFRIVKVPLHKKKHLDGWKHFILMFSCGIYSLVLLLINSLLGDVF